MTPGGVFDFDAVSDDGKLVANISTSGSKTASGKNAVGKMLKVRSDIYFLFLTKAERTLVLLTEHDMYEQWLKEVENGRVPSSIEFCSCRNSRRSELEATRGSSQGISRGDAEMSAPHNKPFETGDAMC